MDLNEFNLSTSDSSSVSVNNSAKKRKSVVITEGIGAEMKKQRLVDDEELPKDNAGWKIMYQMGYTKGKGLGVYSQGITEPVAPDTQQSKRGLGLISESVPLEMPKTKWSAALDPASAKGDIVISIDGERFFDDDSDLTEGMVVGESILSIEGQTRFCDKELLSEMLKCKTMLDNVGTFLDGRSRSNPYEKIGAGIFLNRAAMKMANIDSVTDGLLTTTVDNETLFFADICAGPGGFTEYMLFRRPMQSCGFGFTLKEVNDFKLQEIICGPVECFHPSYGSTDTGDIFVEANLRKFQQEVMSGTGNLGVHTVLADGGFSVEGQENIQEILSKQLYLCQFLCAINILRPGGNFLCKLFDTFTDFSVGLIHLLAALFGKVSIIKPITSRPANSERYVLFQELIDERQRLESVRNYLYEINTKINDLKDSDQDVIKIVSRKTLKNDQEFCQFIKATNDKILEQQIVALAKLMSFIRDRNLVDDRQNDIRSEALRLWKIPDAFRDQYKAMKATSGINKFVKVELRNVFGGLCAAGLKTVTVLDDDHFRKDKFVVKNHVAGFVSSSAKELEQSMYVIVRDKLGVRWFQRMSDRQPLRLSPVIRKWLPSIPAMTFLLVHFSIEYGGDKGNLKVNSVTVIDGAMIYGEDISALSYEKRMAKIANMCRLLDPKNKGHIKPLEFFPLSDILTIVQDRISVREAKGGIRQSMITSNNGHRFFPPWTLVILNIVSSQWLIALSRSSHNLYYYNVHTRTSLVDRPPDLYCSYSDSNIYEVNWITNGDHFLDLFRHKS